MTQLLFRNFQLLEPEVGELHGGFELLVEGETVREVSDKPIKAPGADVVDCGGRTLMPGLIDSHVHVILSEVNFRYLEGVPLTLMTARAARLMLGMLNRGFTTVRDTGGADWGIKTAVEQGDIPGPRLFIAGARDRADRRPQRSALAHRLRPALPLLRCHALRDARSRTACPRCARRRASRCARAPTTSRS